MSETPIAISELCDSAELALIKTCGGRLRRLLIGKTRHRMAVQKTIEACVDINPSEIHPLRVRMCVDRATFEIERAYGFIWWLFLIQISAKVIEWWMQKQKISKFDSSR